ncbi:MAG TPA: hypothetical protein VMY34_06950 [Acidimicrobiales bacterium]|nr:hypothetical protein [Acidimicrobiales bacterium]
MTDHSHEDQLDCRRALEALYTYIDYRRGLEPPVGPVEIEVLIQHYEKHCGGCAEVADVEYRFLARVKRACHGGETLPDGLITRVLQSFREPGTGAAPSSLL